MKKLSFKWKSFLVLSYVQLVIYSLFMLYLLYMIFFQSERFGSAGQLNSFHIGLLLVILNHILNVYTVHKYFPAQVNPPANRFLIIFLGVIMCVILFLMLGGYSYILFRDSSRQRIASNPATLILTLIMATTCLVNVVTVILQFGISSYLSRNSKRTSAELINSIGNDSPESE